jgi:uncharacterized protein
MYEYFPTGIWQFIIGGSLIGLGTGLIYLLTGIYGGVSGSFSALFSGNNRLRRILFMLSIPLGALVYTLATGTWFVTTVSWQRMLLGGLLVGIGVRMGRGCTSGHGVCGLSALSKDSLVSVIVFMGVAIITALTISVVGL